MKIKSWATVGRPRILSNKNNKSFGIQRFTNPYNGAIEDYSFFQGRFISVIIFAVTPDQKIVTIRQFRHGVNQILTELPGGNKNYRESTYQAAKRDLLEETGFTSKKFIRLKPSKVLIEPSSFKNFYIPYLAVDCYRVSMPKLDTTEFIETTTIPIRKWLNMIYGGLIIDCKTLTTTLLSLTYLGLTKR